jgi:hypothetical protein
MSILDKKTQLLQSPVSAARIRLPRGPEVKKVLTKTKRRLIYFPPNIRHREPFAVDRNIGLSN